MKYSIIEYLIVMSEYFSKENQLTISIFFKNNECCGFKKCMHYTLIYDVRIRIMDHRVWAIKKKQQKSIIKNL